MFVKFHGTPFMLLLLIIFIRYNWHSREKYEGPPVELDTLVIVCTIEQLRSTGLPTWNSYAFSKNNRSLERC
ncbi:hypothetical protein C8R41DRAFT_856396 [Lentinula lateritia]|uniref:Secreted protein n=1 Tax=Lentinula lateritia TaxID=40482 RepID=A0ABQ8UZC2_9AGAR|nr:hypothetical protein C8R41DRAFT_856396 [Lentinula lateritia]